MKMALSQARRRAARGTGARDRAEEAAVVQSEGPDGGDSGEPASDTTTEQRSARDILTEARLLRQRAAVLDHLFGVVRERFLPDDAKGRVPFSVQLGDAGLVTPDLQVVLELSAEIAKGAEATRARARSLLGVTVDAPLAEQREAVFGGPWHWTREPDPDADEAAAEDCVVERPALPERSARRSPLSG